jgi:hypothetical protein
MNFVANVAWNAHEAKYAVVDETYMLMGREEGLDTMD